MTNSAFYIISAIIQLLFYISIAAGIVISAIAFWKIAKVQQSLTETVRLIAVKLNVELPDEDDEDEEKMKENNPER